MTSRKMKILTKGRYAKMYIIKVNNAYIIDKNAHSVKTSTTLK